MIPTERDATAQVMYEAYYEGYYAPSWPSLQLWVKERWLRAADAADRAQTVRAAGRILTESTR